MKIGTKSNVSEEVFDIVENKVEKAKINGIKITINKDITQMQYTILVGTSSYYREENEIFKTKEDLIKSL